MVTGRIAIIPARGGSKRIPKKNIINFCGKPMISWTIRAAVNSGLFDNVLVSTDDAEIAAVSLEYGASVPFLRDQAADDVTPVSSATIHALNNAQTYWSKSFDSVVQLMPNCPLRQAEDIQRAVNHFEQVQWQFQVSCFRFGWMNPWWAARLDEDAHPERLFEQTVGQRSQDLDALYCPTGAIWIANATALCKEGTFYGPDHIYFPMHWTAAVDIDDADDVQMAEAVSMLPQYKKYFHG